MTAYVDRVTVTVNVRITATAANPFKMMPPSFVQVPQNCRQKATDSI